MVRSTVSRLAFTMIELIFAIVVIAIAVLSLPVMVQITSKGIENNLVQEAIFAASAELMGATSYYWDENSMQDIATSQLSRVIDLNANCNDDRLRPGHIAQPYHRRCLDLNTTGANDAAGGTIPDLNDAAALVTSTPALFDNPTGSAAGYKDSYTSSLSISRTGNIKFLEATIQDSDGNDIVVLRTQSANVGEIDYYKRRF